MSEQVAPVAETAKDIKVVLFAQRDAWNAGDLDGYMVGCWNNDQFTCISSDGVTRGWNAMRDRYVARFPDARAMGTLSLVLHQIDVLGDDAAMVLGGMTVVDADGRKGRGNFTLVMRLIDGQWRITHDHSTMMEEGI